MRDASARGPCSFDPVAVGHHDSDAWAANCRHQWTATALSHRWVSGGCDRTDPILAAKRHPLVASYSALLDAVSRVQDRLP